MYRLYEENRVKELALVNDAGYGVMSSIDLTGKRVLEIGAGDIRHMKFGVVNPRIFTGRRLRRDDEFC